VKHHNILDLDLSFAFYVSQNAAELQLFALDFMFPRDQIHASRHEISMCLGLKLSADTTKKQPFSDSISRLSAE
jgi:hypothetical protein